LRRCVLSRERDDSGTLARPPSSSAAAPRLVRSPPGADPLPLPSSSI
jgi:hypothetical protein